MRKIGVHPVLQGDGSSDCLLASLVTVLSQYGEQETIESLLTHPIIEKTRNLSISFITLQQIGIIAREKGYHVDLQLANPLLFTILDTSQSLDIDGRIQSIKDKIQDHPEKIVSLESMQEFLRKGGTIDIRMPSIKDIQGALDESVTPITIGTTRFLYDAEPDFDLHATVVIGDDEDSFLIFDPIEGEKLVPKDAYLFGMIASSYADYDNGGILKIYK